ncbi:MAG: ComEC/Rec2 family competence protein [Lentimicrobiaceae bacterium]
MNVWARFPFVRLLVPFIVGILACYYSDARVDISVWAVIVCFITLVLCQFFVSQFSTYRNRWLFGFLLNASMFLGGYVVTSGTFLKNQPVHFSKIEGGSLTYIAKVIEQPVDKQQSVKLLLSVIEVRNQNTSFRTSGNVICYIARDSLSAVSAYGDVLLFKKKPELNTPPGNPGEFDYSAYLAHKNIFHQVYLPKGACQIIDTGKGNFIKAFAVQSRKIFLNILKHNNISGKELSVAAALLIGYDDLLDANLRQEYSGAGVVHILSVSGLHVGVIYLLAGYAFFFLRRQKRFLYLEPFLIILVIWFYSLITGLAPPVLRASIMFTLILIGQSMQRQSNTINTLAAAAFLLLTMNPRLLFNVGFQLSFSAVAGIVFFQPSIRKLWMPKNPLARFVWDIICVSLAAQVFTAPLAAYYFHQFPNFFLFSNVVAIPLSGLLIYTGVLLFLTSFIPVVGKLVAIVLTAELKALNASVSFIESLPGAVSENIYLSELSLILLLILLVSGIYWLINNRKSLLFVSLSCLLLLVIHTVVREISINNRQMIIFYQVNKHPAFSFIDGRTQVLVSDSTVFNNVKTLSYQVDGFRVQAGLDKPVQQCLPFTTYIRGKYNTTVSCPEFYYFKGKRIAVLSGRCKLPRSKKVLKTDYVLLCNNLSIPISDLAEYFPGALMLFDASNSDRASNKMEAEADIMGLACHNIKRKGALIIKL